MSRTDARTILRALVHDGIKPNDLSERAKEEIRAALDVVLRLCN